jgi:hypothetical protein
VKNFKEKAKQIPPTEETYSAYTPSALFSVAILLELTLRHGNPDKLLFVSLTMLI